MNCILIMALIAHSCMHKYVWNVSLDIMRCSLEVNVCISVFVDFRKCFDGSQTAYSNNVQKQVTSLTFKLQFKY